MARTAIKNRPRSNLRNYFRRANLLTSLILIFPLFLFYELAILAAPKDVGNGADLITGQLMRVLGSWQELAIFDVAMVALFVVVLLVLRRRNQFDPRLFVPVVVESGIDALTMGSLICYVMGLLHINPALMVESLPAATAAAAKQAGPLVRVALSFGAGVDEELVFRLGMIPALTWLCERAMGMRKWVALAIAFVVSSLLFSAAHHVIGGEAWHLGPFVYRVFCGLIFATLFQLRGLGVAVYTHALYDVYVMLFGG